MPASIKNEDGLPSDDSNEIDINALDGAELNTQLQDESNEFLTDTNGLSEEALELKQQIDMIKVAMPEEEPEEEEVFDPDLFPESYKENTNKEKLVLAYAENFQKQYVHLFRDRKPLFLSPVNECGCEKFVCTTIRVTALPYKELYDWTGCAEIVADYLNFKPLKPPYELPTRMLAPATVLKRQAGNCFEYSTLLCSLLLGSGYDAYVVCGYATREICNMDETREICPILKKKPPTKEEEKKAEAKKYAVKPPKDLRSKFILKQEARKQKAEDDATEKRRIDAEKEREESEKPLPDDLHGLRIHAWVLVLAGKREVSEKFFIEPLTGIAYPTSSPHFLGIESIWNHKNYWVNMQICTEGVQDLSFDLDDCTLWEFMFPGGERSNLLIPEDDDDLMGDGDDEEKRNDVEKYLDMPPSWTNPIELSLKDYQTRCPLGKKIKLYNRATLEKFAPYLMKDGLVTRLTVFEDKEKSDIVSSRELYKHRVDKLLERIHNQRTGWVVEHFAAGRLYNIKDHHYKAVASGVENDRLMTFYHEARVDGLERRIEIPTEMTEHFINRPDFLFFRQVFFGKRTKKFAPSSESNPRPILKIVEKYHRDWSIPANESISELVFQISDDKILITYHTDDEKIACSTREFSKPQTTEEKSGSIQWNPDGYIKFLVEPRKGDKKNVELYQLLVKLVQREEKSREKVRASEDEVRSILELRMKEESVLEMDVSIYDTARNEKAKKHRAELERLELEEKLRKQEKELDYLAPFLVDLEDQRINSKQMASKLKEDCLADLKRRLLEEANIIQARFEKEAAELQKKQTWYQQNQVTMQKEDEEEYLAFCSEAMFRIHILELRLNRHKEMAPFKYMELLSKLNNDFRLAEFL